MRHFKSSVPEAIKTKLAALAELALEQLPEMGGKSHGALMGPNMHTIEGNHVSGWIPKQDGGYTVDQFYQSDVDSSHHFTEKQTEYMNGQQESCYKAFLMDNKIDIDTEWSDLTDEQKEMCTSYENEWFSDGALLQLQMFAEGFDPEKLFKDREAVVIRICVNYKDGPYFREGYAEDIKYIGYDVEEFMATPNEELIKAFTL